MRIPMVRGRPFGDRDSRSAPGVVIVNQTLARRLWNSEDVVGRRVRFDSPKAGTLEVVGVAQDAKYDEPTERPRPFLYLPLAQHPVIDTETLLVRMRAGSACATDRARRCHTRARSPVACIRRAAVRDGAARAGGQAAGHDRPVRQLRAARDGAGLARPFGVMAYTMACRTREMGVRLALGATPGQLIRLVARDGLRLALIGTFIGVMLSRSVGKGVGCRRVRHRDGG